MHTVNGGQGIIIEAGGEQHGGNLRALNDTLALTY